MFQPRVIEGEVTMSTKTKIAAVAVLVAAIAAPELASAQATFNGYAGAGHDVSQTAAQQTMQQRAAKLPAGTYASTVSSQRVHQAPVVAPQAVQPDFQFTG